MYKKILEKFTNLKRRLIKFEKGHVFEKVHGILIKKELTHLTNKKKKDATIKWKFLKEKGNHTLGRKSCVYTKGKMVRLGLYMVHTRETKHTSREFYKEIRKGKKEPPKPDHLSLSIYT